jgi:hypothetical protein
MGMTALVWLAGPTVGAEAQSPRYGYAQVDMEAPIDPIPVRADGKIHLRYEIHATSFQRGKVEFLRLDVLRDDPAGSVLRSFQGPDFDRRIIQLGNPVDPKTARVVPFGTRAFLFVDLDFATADDVPAVLRHRLLVKVEHSQGASGEGPVEGP